MFNQDLRRCISLRLRCARMRSALVLTRNSRDAVTQVTRYTVTLSLRVTRYIVTPSLSVTRYSVTLSLS